MDSGHEGFGEIIGELRKGAAGRGGSVASIMSWGFVVALASHEEEKEGLITQGTVDSLDGGNFMVTLCLMFAIAHLTLTPRAAKMLSSDE